MTEAALLQRQALRWVPWWHPAYELETVNFDYLLIPVKAKSQRVKDGGGQSWQAVRNGCEVVVKCFFLSRLQRHMEWRFCARQWPQHSLDQFRFVERLHMEMVQRVFNEEWEPHIARQANAIALAIREVLE